MNTVKKSDRREVLKRYEVPKRCIFCGRYDGKEFRNHLVCDECLDYIRETFIE